MEYPNFSIEWDAHKKQLWPVIGVDEAGRGALAGPVVVAAVQLDPENIPHGIRDSKEISPQKRMDIAQNIKKHCKIAITVADVKRIDKHNILHATLWAMTQAIHKINHPKPKIALIDGNQIPHARCMTIPVIKGDQKSLSIAAASIIAKTFRDRIMQNIGQKYPQYNFEKHKGYGTKEHIAALKKFGKSPQHRCSFKPVRDI